MALKESMQQGGVMQQSSPSCFSTQQEFNQAKIQIIVCNSFKYRVFSFNYSRLESELISSSLFAVLFTRLTLLENMQQFLPLIC